MLDADQDSKRLGMVKWRKRILDRNRLEFPLVYPFIAWHGTQYLALREYVGVVP